MARIVLKIVLLCKFVALVTSAAIKDESLAQIVESKSTIDDKGNYKFSFDTTNGLERYEEGKVINYGEPDQYIEVTGYYAYIDDNGEQVIISYTADKDGYQSQIFDKSAVTTYSEIPSTILASLAG